MSHPKDVHAISENGIKIVESYIPNTFITPEDPIDITQCYKCFKFAHKAADCQDTNIYCSKCSENHHYKNCPTPENYKCILCSGSHTATSKTCPVRLNHIKNELDTKKTARTTNQAKTKSTSENPTPANTINTKKSYSQVLARTPLTTPTPTTNIQPPTNNNELTPDQDWNTQLYIATKYAEIKAKGDELVFLATINEFLTQNKRPVVCMSYSIPTSSPEETVNNSDINVSTSTTTEKSEPGNTRSPDESPCNPQADNTSKEPETEIPEEKEEDEDATTTYETESEATPPEEELNQEENEEETDSTQEKAEWFADITDSKLPDKKQITFLSCPLPHISHPKLSKAQRQTDHCLYAITGYNISKFRYRYEQACVEAKDDAETFHKLITSFVTKSNTRIIEIYRNAQLDGRK